MGTRRYSPRVLMGNWLEDSLIIEEKKQLFKTRKERGELSIQKKRRLLCNVLKEVPLSLPEDCVRFGSVVQFMAPNVLGAPIGDPGKCGLVLSCAPSEAEIEYGEHLAEGWTICGSPRQEACVRNAFIICSPDEPKDGQPLHYGESFILRPAVTMNEECLYVCSKLGPLVSELGRSGEPTLQLTSEKNTYARWHCLYIDPKLRPETEGSPVIPNQRLVVCHSSTNRRLAVEHAFWYKTLFGLECEVALHTYFDVHRREMERNIWMIVTQKHGENKVAKNTINEH